MRKRRTGPEQASSIVSKKGIVRSSALQKRGVSRETIKRMTAKGELLQLARGIYAPPEMSISQSSVLAIAAIRIPHGVICLLSALQYYDITTQVPDCIWIAIENHRQASKIADLPVRFVWLSGESLTTGIRTVAIDGVKVKIYSPAKTIVQCFKFRNKIGFDVALEALREGWRKKLFTMDDIWTSAKASRMSNVMRPYLEGLV